MKMCMDHWTKLREAIIDRGLESLISKNGFEAAQRAVDEIEGTPTQYDPLMAANWMIFGKATEFLGLYLLTKDELCPVCEMMTHAADKADVMGNKKTAQEIEEFFIDGPADAVLEYCQENHLIHGIQ